MRARATPSPRPAPGVRLAPYRGGADYGDWKRSTRDYMDAVNAYHGIGKA